MRVEQTVRVNAVAKDVWAAFNDWGGVVRFQPWVVRSPLLSTNNEGPGASRRCEFSDGTSIVETITGIEEGRRIDMVLSETPKPMTGGTGSIVLSPEGMATDVSVTMDVTLGLGPLSPIVGTLMMRPTMRGRITRMLRSLEYHLNTGGKLDEKGNPVKAGKPVAA